MENIPFSSPFAELGGRGVELRALCMLGKHFYHWYILSLFHVFLRIIWLLEYPKGIYQVFTVVQIYVFFDLLPSLSVTESEGTDMSNIV
jgi:hypothetical protein